MKKTEQCVESFHLEQLCGNQGRIKWARGPGQSHDREAP